MRPSSFPNDEASNKPRPIQVGEPRLAGEETKRNCDENSYELSWASAADLVPWNLQPVGIRGLVADVLIELSTERSDQDGEHMCVAEHLEGRTGGA